MKESIIRQKTFALALRIVKLHKYLAQEKHEFVMSKQLLRSGTGVGALVREAQNAESKADFIHKMSIALKEANETEYWIELLYKSGYLDANTYSKIHSEALSVLRMLISIVKTSKSNL